MTGDGRWQPRKGLARSFGSLSATIARGMDAAGENDGDGLKSIEHGAQQGDRAPSSADWLHGPVWWRMSESQVGTGLVEEREAVGRGEAGETYRGWWRR